MGNIKTANFGKNQKSIIVKGLYQYDFGQILEVRGLELPTNFEVHFASEENEESVTRIATTVNNVATVAIPDMFLAEGLLPRQTRNLYAYIYISNEKNGQTEYKIILRILGRAKPGAYDKPEDINAISEIMGILNTINAEIKEMKENIAELQKNAGIQAKTLSFISATFSPGQNAIYTNSTLNDLRQYLVVKANYSDGSFVDVTDYTLSGSLATVGTTTITVSYSNKTTTFNVTVEQQTGDEPEVEILAVFPDMYNTGCDNNYDNIIQDDVSGTINTINSVKFAYSSGGLKLNCTSVVDGTLVEINNTNFCNNNITYIQAINTYTTGDTETKDITFIFRNCNIPAIKATFGYTSNVKSRIKYEFYNCTINDTVSCENMKLYNCKIKLTSGDGFGAYLNCELKDCYAYEDYTTALPDGHHLDIFQTIGYTNYEGEKLIVENCNFCLPYINNTLSTGAYPNACLMIQPDYSIYNGIDIKSLYCNGGGYSVYLNHKKFLINGTVGKIEVGCMRQFGRTYPTVSSGITGVENIIDTTNCYVGTVKQSGDNTLLYATNYTNEAKNLKIVTNNGEYTKTVDKCPLYTEISGSKYTTFESFPFNFEISIPACTWAKVYEENILIRDYKKS